MRRPDDALFLDMLVHARLISERAEALTRATFDHDTLLQMGLVHLLQIIGEAASRLTSEQRAAHDEVPWRDIIGMRHVIVHDYFRIDRDLVWSVVTRDIPPLVEALERIVSSLGDE